MRGSIAAVLVLLLAGCAEKGRETAAGENGGTVVIVTLEDPGSLFPPFIQTTSAKQITEQIYDFLADVGPDLDTRDDKKFRRQLADSWTWSSDSLSLTFHINPRARWHDGINVTAKDVRFTYQLNNSPAVASRYLSSLANIDSVTVGDSLTATFWFHRRVPTQFLDAAAQLLILPAHQLERIPLDRLRQVVPPAPIGSGRFRFRRLDKDGSVEIVTDTGNYRGRAKLDRVIWSPITDFTTAVARVSGGEADLFDGLRPENVKPLQTRPNLRTIILPGMGYGFLRFNLRDPGNRARHNPLFGDLDLRRAIAMSIDRNALVRSVFDTFAVVPVGPTVRAFPSTDPRLAQIPFDSAHASRLLDSLGWIRSGSGVRAKNGKELAFTIIVTSQNLNRVRMSVLVQEQLRRMGMQVNVDRMESSAQTAREERGDFDAAIDAWTMPSSPDATRDAWSSTGIGKNGVNYGSYSNPRFDSLLENALASDPARARDKFSAAYAVINDDAPAVWLYEPRKILGIHRRIRTAQTRPDAWWFSLADWYIPPAERVLRDRIGTR
jgi:peptide/nickel transport system substrate-binding protein